MAKNVFLFQDHDNSYLIWKRFKVKNMPVLHIDTHFDFSDDISNKTLDKIKKTTKEKELKKFRVKGKLPQDGFHIGNFLYPALMDNTISKIIWVVPDFLVKDSNFLLWTYNELANWLNPLISDLKSLEYKEGSIYGKLFSKPLIITTLSALKEIPEPILLDIDLDYFFNDKTDLIWLHPYKFIDIIKDKVKNPYLTTIALSNNGGYTHLQNSYIGDILYNYFFNKIKVVKSSTLNRIFIADKEFLLNNNLKKAIQLYKEVLSENKDFKYKEYIYYKLYLISQIENLDNLMEYKKLAKVIIDKDTPLQHSLMLYRKGLYKQALNQLESIDKKDLFINLTLAYMTLEKKDFSKSKEFFEFILQNYKKQVNNYLLARIYQDLGVVFYHLSNYKKALFYFEKALSMDQNLFNSYFYLGQIYTKLDNINKAISSYRRALRLAENTLASLDILINLYVLYEYKEDKNRANVMLSKLKELDFKGVYYLKAILKKNAFKKTK